jgi:hypothetical protein
MDDARAQRSKHLGTDTAQLVEQLARSEDEDERALILSVLEGRQRPFAEAPAAASGRSKATRPLGVESNGKVGEPEDGRLVLQFPKDGYLSCGRSSFDGEEDLVRYVGEALGLDVKGASLRLSLSRAGKYQRVGRSGRPAFTFGDPVLDAITDEDGWVKVGDESFHLVPGALGGQGRRGGLRIVDLAVDAEALRAAQLAEALSPAGTRTLVEHDAEHTVLATTNPSQLDMWQGSAHLRFRSWKTNYYVYRSIGTEIETWGGDFSSASIQSMYADPVVPNNPFVCGITKRDSDSDTNDDYVDEYEVGVFASPAGSVRSTCSAQWKGRPWGGIVSKGACEQYL